MGVAARVALARAHGANSRRMTRTNASRRCVVAVDARAPRVVDDVADIVIIINNRARLCRHTMSDLFVDVDASAVTPVEKACASDASAFDAALARRSMRDDDDEGEDASTSVRRCAAPLDAFIASACVSDDECDALIDAARRAGYTFWHADADAPNRRSFRNADTVEVVSTRAAEELWRRLRAHVTPEITIAGDDETHGAGATGKWVARGINAHLLFNRYEEGGHFSPHTDGATVVDFNTRSMYSVLVYLNDCADGGETVMFAPPKECEPSKFIRDDDARYRWPREWIADAAPAKRGSALVFRQDIPHEGAPVGPGALKLIIRTDVMYERDPPAFADEVGLRAYALHRDAVRAEADGDAMEAMRLFRYCRRLCPAYADFVGI